MRVVLLQPPTANQHTGGNLYNRRMVDDAPAGARIGLVQAHGGDAAALAAAIAGLTHPPEVIVLDSLWLDTPTAVACVRAALPEARLVWLLHGLPSSFRDGATEPAQHELDAIAGGDAVIAPGGYLPGVLGRAGVQVPTIICPPGVDRAFRIAGLARSGGDDEEEEHALPLVLTVGPVVPQKGQDALLDALASQSAPWRWQVVGALDVDPAFAGELRARIASIGLEARVELTGPLAPEAMPARYGAAALFALASRSENSPLSIREALAAGLPVVATDVGGVAELFTHGHEGVLAAPDDPFSLSLALAELLGDAGRRAAMSARARAHGARMPHWPAAAADFTDALGRIAPPR